MVPKLSKLADECRSKGMLVIFTTQVFRKDGSDTGIHAKFRPEAVSGGLLFESSPRVELYEGLKPQTGDIVSTKRRFSAFLGTELDLILRSKAIDTLIIAGCATNICCESTARDARRDYQVIFLSDGTAPQEIPDRGWGQFTADEVQRFALATMAGRFA